MFSQNAWIQTKFLTHFAGILEFMSVINDRLSNGLVLGFTAIQKGESPALFAKPLMKRMPKRVKARKRVVVYDNCW